jgi:hypothetical protein
MTSTGGDDRHLDSDLIAHFDLRGGYLRPPERAGKLNLIEPMLSEDLKVWATHTS